MTEKPAGINLDPAIEKKLLGWFLFILAVVVLMAVAATRNTLHQAESRDWVNHTHAFILEADAILSSLHAAESAQRIYLMTGEAPASAAAEERFAEVLEHVAVAKALGAGSPRQSARLAKLEELVNRQLALNRQAGQLRQSGGPAAAAALFTQPSAKAAMAEIESETANAKLEENALLLEREQALERHTRRTQQILFTGAGLNLVLLGFALYLVRMDVRIRRAAAAALQAANDSLEIKVAERTAELARANEKLQIENLEQRWGQAAMVRLVGHHELILNSIREAIFVISRRGKIVSSNAAAAQLAGLDSKQLAGQSIRLLLLENPARPVQWEQHPLAATVRAGTPVEACPMHFKQADGRVVPVNFTSYPARDQENLTGAVVIVTVV